eukprot:gene28715-31887_t
MAAAKPGQAKPSSAWLQQSQAKPSSAWLQQEAQAIKSQGRVPWPCSKAQAVPGLHARRGAQAIGQAFAAGGAAKPGRGRGGDELQSVPGLTGKAQANASMGLAAAKPGQAKPRFLGLYKGQGQAAQSGWLQQSQAKHSPGQARSQGSAMAAAKPCQGAKQAVAWLHAKKPGQASQKPLPGCRKARPS